MRRRTRLWPLAGLLLLAGCGPVAGLTPAGVSVPPAALPASPSATLRLGADTVRILGTGDATFSELRRLIDGARLSVEVEVYEFGRRDLAAALVAATTRGVAVTVIDDRTETASAATMVGLRAAGVDVVDYPVRARMIDHVKLLVVDATTAVVGGINWGARSAANHDFDAEVTGPAASNLARVFRRDLVACGRAVTVADALPDPRVVVATTLPGSEIRPLVLAAILGARRTLDIAMYTFTDTTVLAAIESAAASGVRVRVLLDPSERPNDPAAASLRAHGVPVELYRGHGELLHAKAGIADGATVVFGSANWTVSGFGHNHELDVEIPGAPEVAAAFTAQFAGDWAASA
ncbi:MAG: phospholipase D-like domain-containing protein [Candidatus Dormibacteria bacterium]